MNFAWTHFPCLVRNKVLILPPKSRSREQAWGGTSYPVHKLTTCSRTKLPLHHRRLSFPPSLMRKISSYVNCFAMVRALQPFRRCWVSTVSILFPWQNTRHALDPIRMWTHLWPCSSRGLVGWKSIPDTTCFCGTFTRSTNPWVDWSTILPRPASTPAVTQRVDGELRHHSDTPSSRRSSVGVGRWPR